MEKSNKKSIEVETLKICLRALTDSIRYQHLKGEAASYEMQDNIRAHHRITRALYRSQEMRDAEALAWSIRQGTDLGLEYDRKAIAEMGAVLLEKGGAIL